MADIATKLKVIEGRKVDDAVREVHGVRCRRTDEVNATATLTEYDQNIWLELSTAGAVKMTPWQARYLASKLYRLSRRCRQRSEVPA